MKGQLRFEDAVRFLPPGWRAALAGHAAAPAPGMGGASVFRLSGPANACRYLKLACGPEAEPLKQEIMRTEWLSSRHVRVPKFLMKVSTGPTAAVLMAALPGRHPAPGDGDVLTTARLIGRGLARLHAIPVADCPFDEMPRTRLRQAREAVDRGLIDAGEFEHRNAGLTPAMLYERLAGTIPTSEDIVVVHGDATLSNMLIGPDGEVGFIDCGRAGRSDRYVDLAVVEAELRTVFGRDAARAFVTACGIHEWDDRKSAFFRDLYEFF
jgi:aminoglycoside 3'-phosphotransferase II